MDGDVVGRGVFAEETSDYACPERRRRATLIRPTFCGAEVVYLPPYSPDLSPIKGMP